MEEEYQLIFMFEHICLVCDHLLELDKPGTPTTTAGTLALRRYPLPSREIIRPAYLRPDNGPLSHQHLMVQKSPLHFCYISRELGALR